MKRKYMALLLAASMVFTLGACGTSSDAPVEENDAPVDTGNADAQEDTLSKTSGNGVTESGTVTTSGDYVINLSDLEHHTDAEDVPAVYFTNEITSESLMAIYEALGRVPGGNRASTALHMQVAEDRGYTAIADVDIMDANGGLEIPVIGGTRLETNQVGSHFTDYDFFVVLSHFKGHAQGGFGGALKNMSIGIASSEGKSLIHSGGAETTGFGWNTPAEVFTESMAEAAKSVYDYLGEGENLLYINVMNYVSVDCDCNANPASPDMRDIGILASSDPVALDQACVDLVYASKDNNASLIQRMESRNAYNVLSHGEEIGLGNRTYSLVIIPE